MASLRAAVTRTQLLALTTLLAATVLIGCREEIREPMPPVIDRHQISITAFLAPDSTPEQRTIELLNTLRDGHPDRIDLTIIDITDGDQGTARWRALELDSVAISFNGCITVSWGEGEERRTVSFLHPPGFAWNHDDLREAVEAALRGELRPAEPEEAEGLRLVSATVRGQSIRIGDSAEETGQLVIDDQPVISITQSRGALAPGQRVSIAAQALEDVLDRPFTPSQLAVRRIDGEITLVAGEEPLLIATEEDAEVEQTTPEGLAHDWLRALRRALIAAVQPEASASPPPPTD